MHEGKCPEKSPHAWAALRAHRIRRARERAAPAEPDEKGETRETKVRRNEDREVDRKRKRERKPGEITYVVNVRLEELLKKSRRAPESGALSLSLSFFFSRQLAIEFI